MGVSRLIRWRIGYDRGVLQIGRDRRVRGPELVALSVGGELDVAGTASLQAQGLEIVAGDCQHLLIDLDTLLHIDSRGLGTFVELRQKMREKRGTLSFVCNNPRLRRLFHLTNLERLFTFYESVSHFVTAHGGELAAAEGEAR